MNDNTEDQFAEALAHQLKTPTSTLQAATMNLRRNLRGLLEDLASMAGDQLPAGVTARFISRAVGNAAPAPITGLLPEERLEMLATRLAQAGLQGDLESAAASLVRGGWDTDMDEIAPLLRGDRPLALDLLETTARLRANLAAVEASLERIRGIATALRLLARPVEGGRVDLVENLETTLALFHETLPPGVAVVTRFEAPPPVAGRADLLGEVWANLITNAAQAVGEKGTITIEAGPSSSECWTVVRVIDDGPGIPAEALPRVFEPFFTTRGSEGGSGLGLALAHRIIEKLGGEIEVASRPGRTCFTIILAAAGAAQNARG